MLPNLNNLPTYDTTGVKERVDRFCKRSIKKSSKIEGLRLALSMIDLTTLEGKDTTGKVSQLCYKAMHPHDVLKNLPTVAAICVYQDSLWDSFLLPYLFNFNIANNYSPKNIFNGVIMTEEFSPLIKVDLVMKNSFSLRAAYNKDKTLNLNVSNNSITEILGSEVVVGLGYRIRNVKMKFKNGARTTTFQGDVNFKADIGIRDNLTLIRTYGDTDDLENDQITGGQNLVSFKFIADYSLNKNLLTSFYFDYNKSKFAISTTYPRLAINGGISVRYIIGN